MALRGRSHAAARVRPAAVEGLEQRQLFCATHVLTETALLTTLEPEGALPGQVNGNSIFGGGIYGAAAASYTARADGLPLLNSRPGSPFTVFLDFDGWVGNGFSGPENWQPYNTDGIAAFNATEAGAIAEGWRRIASFMSPFDVNVTTVEPANLNDPTDNWSWSIISNNVSGGYSYLQLGGPRPAAFNQASDLLSRTSGILHEIGHNFSLQHQSIYDANAVKTTEYRGKLDTIHGVVMGVDYDGTPVKWTYGHPATSAVNAQDDLTVIANKIKPYQPAGSDGFRADDFAGTIASATPLTAGAGGVQSSFGVVERLVDADAFSLTSTGGWYTLNLIPDSPSMLDGKLELYDAGGSLLALSDEQIKIDTNLTLNLPAGTYYAVVKSHGNYSDIGAYELRASAASPVTPPTTNALPAPANVATALASGTGVTVSWNTVGGATQYQVERSLDGATFTTAATVASSSLSYTDASLAGSHRYVYRVRAKDATGVGAASAPSEIVNRPSSVTSLRSTQTSGTQIVLDWLERPESGGETGYRIERSTDNVNFATAGTVGPNVLIFNNTGLTLGTTYYYRIVPTSSLGDGPATATAGIKTRLPAVSDLTFTSKSTTALSIQWTDLPNESGYRVEHSTNGSTWSTLANNAAGVRTHTHSGLTAATEYYYRIVATDSTGSDGVTTAAVFSATTAATPPTSPWTNVDVGAVSSAGAGATSFNSATSTYTLIAGGGNVTGTADQARFTYRSFTGDGSIIARVSALENTSTGAKAGVMWRESTGTNSRVAFMALTRAGSVTFSTRTTAGGTVGNSTATSIGGVAPVAPFWLKLERAGNVFTGFASINGTTWTQVGSPTTIAMPSTALMGLAAASNNTTLLNTSTIDNVTVRGPNAVPVLGNDTLTTGEDTPGTVTVLANDTDGNGDTLTITAVSTPAHGSAVLNANKTITYTPAANYNGADSFTYTVSDGFGGSATGTVSVTVTPANDAPTAGNDAAQVNEDALSAITVLGNDADVDGDVLTVALGTGPAHGAAVVNANKTIGYTPAANYYGPDSLTYSVSDGKGGTATATVTLTVMPVNDAPTLAAIADQSAYAGAGPQTVTLTGIGAGAANETQTLTFAATPLDPDIVTDPTVTYHGDGTATLSYTPGAAGTTSLTVTVTDNGGTANGGVNATTRSFNLTVEDPPVTLPSWVAPGSAATWDDATRTLTVTGAATIVADPAGASPLINVSGTGAALTIDPASDLHVHVAALNLSGGATATLASLGAARTAANHRVLVTAALGIDTLSTLDLADNDLVLDYDNAGPIPAAAVEAAVARGFGPGADWSGASGITSSAARLDSNFAVGVADNALLNTAHTSFAGVPVDTTSVLVKFTWLADLDLDGRVTQGDAITFGNNYSAGDAAWRAVGDLDFDGLFTTNDAILFGNHYDTSLPQL